MYLAARTIDISPDQFWNMTLGELLLELGHRAKAAQDAQRGLSGDDIAELLEFMDEPTADPD